MDERDVLIKELTKKFLYSLCDYSTEELQSILAHVNNPDEWELKSVSEGVRAQLSEVQAERDALYEDLRGTCSVCGDQTISYEPVLGCYHCDHMNRHVIAGFGRKEELRTPPCAKWKWRGIPGKETAISNAAQ